MEISQRENGVSSEVQISGRIDAAEAERFELELTRAEARAPETLAVDLSDVDHLDSSGLAVLVRAWRRTSAAGIRFTLVLPSDEQAQRIFTLTGFDTVFDISEPSRRH